MPTASRFFFCGPLAGGAVMRGDWRPVEGARRVEVGCANCHPLFFAFGERRAIMLCVFVGRPGPLAGGKVMRGGDAGDWRPVEGVRGDNAFGRMPSEDAERVEVGYANCQPLFLLWGKRLGAVRGCWGLAACRGSAGR